MSQQFEQPQRRQQTPAGGIDHLPGEEPVRADQADKILRRAIELQTDESSRRVEPINRDKLVRMARELNVDPDFLLRALAEHQAGALRDDRLDTVWQKLLAPDKVMATRIIKGDTNRVEAAAQDWFRNHEGLRPRRHLEDGILWEKDSHPITSIRMGLKLSQGTGALRTTPGVTHRVREVKPGEQLVSIEADTARLLENWNELEPFTASDGFERTGGGSRGMTLVELLVTVALLSSALLLGAAYLKPLAVPVDQGADLGRVAHVDANDAGAAAVLLDSCARRLHGVGRAAGEDDMGAGVPKGLGDGAADAAGGTGHDGGTTVQGGGIRHVGSSRRDGLGGQITTRTRCRGLGAPGRLRYA